MSPNNGYSQKIYREVLGSLCFSEFMTFLLCVILPLCWDASTNAASYNVYYGPASGIYTNIVNVRTNALALDLSPGSYFFAVTAQSTEGVESELSNEICGVIDSWQPMPQTNIVTLALMQSTNAMQWTPVAVVTLTNVSANASYRLELLQVMQQLKHTKREPLKSPKWIDR